MKSNIGMTFVLFVLSVAAIQVVCDDENDDTSMVEVANVSEYSDFPEFDNNNTIDCRETEEYSRCDAKPECQRNCDNLNDSGIPCQKKSCIEGCVCREKFVRSELYGGCIPEDQCGRVKH